VGSVNIGGKGEISPCERSTAPSTLENEREGKKNKSSLEYSDWATVLPSFYPIHQRDVESQLCGG